MTQADRRRRIFLSVLAAPLWAVGAAAGVTVAVVCWIARAVAVGYSDGRHAG